MRAGTRWGLRGALAIFFVVAGVNHFRDPDFYLQLMPPGLPWPRELIWWTGVAEIAGGLGVIVPAMRVAAGWGLVALLVAVFPANVHAAFQGLEIGGHAVPAWTLWARLPLQLVFVAWVYAACRGPVKSTPRSQT